ncbi:MAG: histidine triad nucleotide-binding protein [Clostridia bacterium]
MEDCLFCKIIEGKISSDKVYEDEFVLAFKDIHPVAPIHVLVIPKKHIKDVNELDEENIKYISKVYLAIKKVAKICNIDESGYRVICNAGEDGGQVVHHIHFHLLGGRHLGSKLVKE